MFEFTESERASLKEMRALSTDGQGREVLIGLTLEETERYMAHSRAFLSKNRDRENRKIYLKLNEKHERARLEIIGTESFVSTNKPSIQ